MHFCRAIQTGCGGRVRCVQFLPDLMDRLASSYEEHIHSCETWKEMEDRKLHLETLKNHKICLFSSPKLYLGINRSLP